MSRPLTIFEMRNEIYMKAYAEKICDFNYNEKLRERVLKYQPMTEIYIDKVCE